jgi:hypothetical protein
LRHVSGIGSSTQAGAPSGNTPLETNGYLGFWLMTEDAGVTVQLAVDDPGSADRGYAQLVIADGQWHLYEWDLEDDSQWEGWVTGNGLITGETTTVDSIFFHGAGDARIYLDDVSHNPDGTLAALPGDYNGDGVVDAADLAMWESEFRVSAVNGGDLLVWQRRFGTGQLTMASLVPETSTVALLLLGLTSILAWTRCEIKSSRPSTLIDLILTDSLRRQGAAQRNTASVRRRGGGQKLANFGRRPTVSDDDERPTNRRPP